MFNQNNAHAVTALIMFCNRMCCNICTSISVTQLDKTWHICLLLQDIHINCLQGVPKVYLRCLKTICQSDHFPLDSQRVNCFFVLFVTQASASWRAKRTSRKTGEKNSWIHIRWDGAEAGCHSRVFKCPSPLKCSCDLLWQLTCA